MDSSGYYESLILRIAYVFNSICCAYPLFKIHKKGKIGKINTIDYNPLL